MTQLHVGASRSEAYINAATSETITAESTMPYRKHELAVPEQAKTDPASYEMLRLWSADGGQFVSLNVQHGTDPAEWGIMIFDLVCHVARAYEQSGFGSTEENYKRVLAGFAAEMQNPTDPLTASITGRG